MNFCTSRFNTYLLLAAFLVAGCQSDKTKAEKKEGKKMSALRINIETKDDNLGMGEQGTTTSIQFPRIDPVNITIFREPILAESDVSRATVMASPGGFSVAIQFDETGSLTLEQFTASNPGKHLVVFGQWTDPDQDSDKAKKDKDKGDGKGNGSTNNPSARWLAAPLISHRIANGVLSFTPDCTRAEADRFVLGLNNVAKKIKKGEMQ